VSSTSPTTDGSAKRIEENKIKRKTLSDVVLLLAGIATSTLVVAAEPSPGWPCWRGPFGNGAGVDCGETLVDDLSNAVVWREEAVVLASPSRPRACARGHECTFRLSRGLSPWPPPPCPT
jgi:hypothetical protein